MIALRPMLALFAAVLQIAGAIPTDNVDRRNSGQIAECEQNTGASAVLIGACGSNRLKACSGRNTHRAFCAKKEHVPFLNGGKLTPWQGAGAGKWLTCPPNSVAIARCGSGGRDDCNVGDNRPNAHALRCKELNPATGFIVSNETEFKCGRQGETLKCSDGYAVTASCGSERSARCDTEFCSGRGRLISVGILCSKIVTGFEVISYEYVNPADPEASSPNPVPFIGDCKKRAFQGSTSVSEEISVTTSVTLEMGSETVERESTTTGASIGVTVASEFGVPLMSQGSVSVTGTFSSEIELSTERKYYESATSSTSTTRSTTLTNDQLDPTIEYALLSFVAGGVAEFGTEAVYGSKTWFTDEVFGDNVEEAATIRLQAGELSFDRILNTSIHPGAATEPCEETARKALNGVHRDELRAFLGLAPARTPTRGTTQKVPQVLYEDNIRVPPQPARRAM